MKVAAHQQHRLAVAEEGGGGAVPALVELMQGWGPMHPVYSPAAGCVAALAAGGQQLKDLLVSAGALQALQQGLHPDMEDGDSARRESLRAIHALISGDEAATYRPAAQEAGLQGAVLLMRRPQEERLQQPAQRPCEATEEERALEDMVMKELLKDWCD